ncbi:uncharacterized protein LOC141638977 [Silene latifolia]|uniref:uncharacterized protein LOC141638977 n=1 Tax=Silene latifolia TaxID=37657 RepID=UPI003D77304B
MFCLVSKLKFLKAKFRNYNKEHFCDIENSSLMALKNLEYIQSQIVQFPGDKDWIDKEHVAIKEYRDLKEACAQFLSQKAKASWIKDGDCNSKYFHGVIKSHFLRNQVLAIKDVNGVEHDDPQHIQEAFLQYYKNLLGESVPTTKVNTKIIRKGITCNAAHSTILLRPITDDEVKAAIFSIPIINLWKLLKIAFYKDSWSIIGDGEWHKGCNIAPKHTFIAWLVAHQALKLKDKRLQFLVCVFDDLSCVELFPKGAIKSRSLTLVGTGWATANGFYSLLPEKME